MGPRREAIRILNRFSISHKLLRYGIRRLLHFHARKIRFLRNDVCGAQKKAIEPSVRKSNARWQGFQTALKGHPRNNG
jgi:hypothetical protein